MHTNRVYTIFWQPSSLPVGVEPFPTAPAYQQVVNSYFERVVSDSHKSSNVYSVATQYSEGASHIEYATTFGGSVEDVDPFPASGCVDGTLPVCLTEKQLEAEIANVIEVNEAHGWTAGPNSVFFLYTPENVGSCFEEEEGPVCSYVFYCAYHSNFTSSGKEILYANMPYQAVEGCDDEARPEGSVAGPAIDTSSHEHIEAITDPAEHGWWDSNGEPETNPYFGQEIADLCLPLEFTSSFAAEAYGPLLGGAYNTAGAFNQAIAGHDYLLQREWSNAAGASVAGNTPGACQQLLLPAGFTPPAEPHATQQASFDASPSGTAEDPVTTWNWNFGDGQTGVGERPTHTYAAAGNYAVTLTVADAREDSNSTSLLVHVTQAPPPEEEHTTTTTTTSTSTSAVVTTASTTTSTTATSTTPSAHAHLSSAELAAMLGLPGDEASLPGTGTITLGRAICPPACSLSVALYAKVHATRHHHRATRRLLVGAAHLTVSAGAATPIAVKLNAAGRALLRRRHRLVVQIMIAAGDQQGAATPLTLTLTLTASRRGARHRHG